jgi:hypothetical protein
MRSPPRWLSALLPVSAFLAFTACGARSALFIGEVSDVGVTVDGGVSAAEASADSAPSDAGGVDEGVPDAEGGSPDAADAFVGTESGVPVDAASEEAGEASSPLLWTPRLIAPLSTAAVITSMPTLHWVLPEGADGARVDLCRDRACTQVIERFDATGTRGAPGSSLPPGVVFWRAAATQGGVPGTQFSPVWEFTVGHHSAPRDTSWGTTLDVNGDGFADVVVGSTQGAYLYLGTASGLSTSPAVTLTRPGGIADYGNAAASAADVNGDGYGDLIVGAPSGLGYGGIQASAYLYLGGPQGISAEPTVTLIDPDMPDEGFGTAVTSIGDENGDGYGDIAIGGASDGYVYLYVGGVGGVSQWPFGTGRGFTATTGDFNGDGYYDVAFGGYSGVDVHLGEPGYLSPTPAVTLPGLSILGSVASAGDVNGDGYDDLVVGDGQPASFSGTAAIFLGGAAGIGSVPTLTLTRPASDGQFGASVGGAGDVNGDGYADVVIGAIGLSGFDGGAYLYLGGAAGLPSNPAISLLPTDERPYEFGVSVASTGDVTGDGFPGVLIGELGRPVSVYPGGPNAIATLPALTLIPPGITAEDADYGLSVFGASD